MLPAKAVSVSQPGIISVGVTFNVHVLYSVRIRTYCLVLNYCKSAGRLRVLKFGVGRHHSATVTIGKQVSLRIHPSLRL